MEGRPATVVTTFAALMTPQVPLDVLEKSVLEVRKRGELSLTETAKRLVFLGYEKQYQVEKPGQFAIRGDILDIFELTEENPYRIELWGDEVDSVRSFSADTQRSDENLEIAEIFPAAEVILTKEQRAAGLAAIRAEAEKIIAAIDRMMARETIPAIRKTKSGMKECDIRPLIYGLRGEGRILFANLALTESEACKPPMLISALAREAGFAEEREIRVLVRRKQLYGRGEDGELKPLERL
jgi:transcription-repair coupling factor (superfamily II helicase)